MCKTTSGSQTANASPVPGIPPNQAGGGGPTGPGTGVPFPEGPAPLVGDPDFYPTRTFIATPSATDNGFIGNAETYHRNSGIQFDSVDSLQQVVEAINTGPTAVIERLRIVSHFFVNDESPGLTPSNIRLSMLRNGGKGILKNLLIGWSQSNYEGLKSMLTVVAIAGGVATEFNGVYADDIAPILNRLSTANGPIVSAIPTDVSGEPGGLHRDFLTFAVSKWVLDNEPTVITDSALRTSMLTAYDLLMNDARDRISTPTPANMLTLATAIVGFSQASMGVYHTATPGNVSWYKANVSSGIAAYQGNFFAAITGMRTRLNQFSTVDIRGCQAGRDLQYLQAIRQFFGTSTTIRPGVTAPTRFQRFNTLGQITGLSNAAGIDHLNNTGASGYNGAAVRTHLDLWATGFGITQAHLDFWHTTFQLTPLVFATLAWKSTIPTRTVAIPRLDGLQTAILDNVFARLGDIFFFATAAVPTTAQRAKLVAVQGSLANWITQLTQTLPGTATPAELQTRFNGIKTIYETVDPRTTSASFSPRIIPATAPAGLSLATIATYRTSLLTFINTDSHSIFNPISVFLGAAVPQPVLASAKLRYFLRLGLVLQLNNPTSTNFNAQILVAFIDASGNHRQDEAIRHWIRCNWRGAQVVTIPAAIPPGINWINGANGSWIVEQRTLGPSFISPQLTYQQHIEKITASTP